METLHDLHDIFHDTHQRVNGLLEPIQQDEKTLTLDIITVPDGNSTHESNTDTHSFTVTTDSNIFKIPTRQIEHNTSHNETTSIQNDFSILSIQHHTLTIQPQTLPKQVTYSYDDPSSIPPQFSTHTTPHNSPQQGSSNNVVQTQCCTTCFSNSISTNHPSYTTIYSSSNF